MTDYDNGLPPEGTTTDAKLSSVTLDSKDANTILPIQANAVTLDSKDVEIIPNIELKNITLSTEPAIAGKNYETFL
ncbi:MAG: hypothetical protein LBN74_02315 [Prevotella sp.]|jgi:hypothetical protein|nr:hypothetical protein [Prevotella sp.]